MASTTTSHIDDGAVDTLLDMSRPSSQTDMHHYFINYIDEPSFGIESESAHTTDPNPSLSMNGDHACRLQVSHLFDEVNRFIVFSCHPIPGQILR